MLREITNFVRILPPNNMRRILLLICLFVILVTPAVAQLYQYLDTQNGLSSRRVLSIRKDKKGYMYSGTIPYKINLNQFAILPVRTKATADCRSLLHFLTPKTTIYCFALKTNNIFSTQIPMNLFNWKVLSRKKSHILQNLRTTNIFWHPATRFTVQN